MPQDKTTKLKRGRDWHGYAMKMLDEEGEPLGWYAMPFIPKKPPEKGTAWVRVKFVEVTECG